MLQQSCRLLQDYCSTHLFYFIAHTVYNHNLTSGDRLGEVKRFSIGKKSLATKSTAGSWQKEGEVSNNELRRYYRID